MIIFSPKGIRRWTSSGVSVKNSKLELTNFSFIEESFEATSERFFIGITGKNIIGNGVFSVSIYVNNEILSKTELSFVGIYHSKKCIEATCKIGSRIKITLSRGKSSSGKILLDQASIIDVTKVILEQQELTNNAEPKKEPKEPGPIKEIVTEKKKRKKRAPKQKEADDNELPTHIGENDNLSASNLTEKLEPSKKKISVVIIDLNSVTGNDKLFYGIINQIVFGKNKQLFLVKQDLLALKDLSKYENVKIYMSDEELIQDLKNLSVDKLTSNEILSETLSSFIKSIKERL